MLFNSNVHSDISEVPIGMHTGTRQYRSDTYAVAGRRVNCLTLTRIYITNILHFLLESKCD